MIINSEDIKKKAIDLGFHKVGIAKASQTKKEEEQLNQWLNNNKHAKYKYVCYILHYFILSMFSSF